MLMPKRVKYRKPQRGKNRGNATAGNRLNFGEFGLQTLERTHMTARQIEAARRTITRYIKRGGKLWIRVFPDKAYTARPAETRMGKGKGAPEYYVAVIKPGHILFELGGIDLKSAEEALRLASHKLPVKTRFVKVADYLYN
jgi:large subunit ribosomal protein L16